MQDSDFDPENPDREDADGQEANGQRRSGQGGTQASTAEDASEDLEEVRWSLPVSLPG